MAKTLGADRVFSKPFSVSDLISEVSSLLRLEQND
jgi:DNA-binding response OmpR family regulator